MTVSLSILLPVAMGYDANRMLAANGMGPDNFSVLCFEAGDLRVGTHAWAPDPSLYTSPPVPVGGWAVHGLSDARVAQITAAMVVSNIPLAESLGANAFEALCGGEGVGWGALLPELPAPGSGATVTANEFYSTEQPGFPVVRVVQTHARSDPSHTDISALLALFEPMRDPFNPAPWVQPAGTIGMYQTTNLIGGPELVTYEGQTWRCTSGNNVWAPGVFGWQVYP